MFHLISQPGKHTLIHWAVFSHGACRIVFYAVLRLAARGSRGTFLKSTAAVGADVLQHMVYALAAEGTFKCADHGVGAAVGQGFVAMFAGGAEFEHDLGVFEI